MSEVAGTVVQQQQGSGDVAGAALAHARDFLAAHGRYVLEPVEEHSNFNYLYRARIAGDAGARCYWLKAADTLPRKLGVALPRARVFAEAETARIFCDQVGHLIDVPRIVYLHRDSHSFLMTDVGAGRRNGLDVLADDYELYQRAVPALAEAVARVHAATAGDGREAAHEQDLRDFAYRELMGPGIRKLAPDHAEPLLQRLATTRECLNHSDLWAKNVLIGTDARLALIDYEGAMRGDPVFDLATLLAAALIPWFQHPAPNPKASWDITRHGILRGYGCGLCHPNWLRRISKRLPGAMAVMLGARCAGPFAYPMPDQARAALGRLCARLARAAATEAFVDWTVFVEQALFDWRGHANRAHTEEH